MALLLREAQLEVAVKVIKTGQFLFFLQTFASELVFKFTIAHASWRL